MRHYFGEIAHRAGILAGATLLTVIGRDRFYLLAQGNGIGGRIARAFTDAPEVVKVVTGIKHVRESRDLIGRNEASFVQYAGQELGGWAVERQKHGDQHNTLTEQLRGQILPIIEERIREGGVSTVVEIGCTNGDVLAWLAERHPTVRFIGIDFDVETAKRLHPLPNADWRAGYALEMIRSGAVAGDVVFASSTLCVCGPKELEAYAAAIRQAGFKTVALTDPVRSRWTPDVTPGESRHLTFGIWGHDYRGYFGREGYRTTTARILDYTKHRRRALIHHQLYRGDQTTL